MRYLTLSAGVIDAVDDSWTTYVATGHFKIAKHYGLTRHSMAPGILVISRIVWEQLPPPDRAIIRAAAKDSVLRMRASVDASELEARREAEQDGVEVIDDVDRKSFADALLPLYPALLSDPKLMDMVRRIQADDEVATSLDGNLPARQHRTRMIGDASSLRFSCGLR